MTTPRESTPIDAIAEEWVDTELDLYPEYRVYLGRPGREGEYSDYSPAGAENAVERTRRTLAVVRAATPLDAVDEVTKIDLERDLALTIDKHEAGFGQRGARVGDGVFDSGRRVVGVFAFTARAAEVDAVLGIQVELGVDPFLGDGVDRRGLAGGVLCFAHSPSLSGRRPALPIACRVIPCRGRSRELSRECLPPHPLRRRTPRA